MADKRDDNLELHLPVDRNDGEFWICLAASKTRTFFLVNIPEGIKDREGFALAADAALRRIAHEFGCRDYNNLTKKVIKDGG